MVSRLSKNVVWFGSCHAQVWEWRLWKSRYETTKQLVSNIFTHMLDGSQLLMDWMAHFYFCCCHSSITWLSLVSLPSSKTKQNHTKHYQTDIKNKQNKEPGKERDGPKALPGLAPSILTILMTSGWLVPWPHDRRTSSLSSLRTWCHPCLKERR